MNWKYKKKDHCHYSGLPSPMAYRKKSKITVIKETIVRWFELNIGWFFVNGNKTDQWNDYLKEKYG